MDFGKQEHIFTGLQAYLFKKIDKFYNIQPHELSDKLDPVIVAELEKPLFSISRVEKPSK